MSNRIFSIIFALAVMLGSVSIALAGDQVQDRTKVQDRLQDGSCQDDAIEAVREKLLAADQDRDRTRDQDRLQDGSCKEDAIDAGSRMLLIASSVV